MLTKNIFLFHASMQLVTFIFNERGVQFLGDTLTWFLLFFPQSNCFIDKKMALVPQIIQRVMLQVEEPCIQK